MALYNVQSISRHDVGPLLVQPVERQSLAFLTATIVRTHASPEATRRCSGQGWTDQLVATPLEQCQWAGFHGDPAPSAEVR